MTMSAFPLVKLPLLPLENIAKQMEFLSLLQLSMMSRKLAGTLQLLKLNPPINFLNVSLEERTTFICINRNGDDISIMEVGRNRGGTRIPDILRRQGRQVNNITVPSEESRLLETLEEVVNHILSIIKVEYFCFTSGNGMRDIRNLFIFRITQQFENLNIRSPYISPEDLTFLLEDISTNRLNLDVRTSPEFKYRKPIKHPVFTIPKCDWLNLETLTLAPDTISARFDNAKVNNSVLDGLIQDWKEGKNLELKEVLFTWKDNDPSNYWRNHPNHPERLAVANEGVQPLNGRRIVVANSREIGPNYTMLYKTRLSVSDQLGRRDQPWRAIVG